MPMGWAGTARGRVRNVPVHLVGSHTRHLESRSGWDRTELAGAGSENASGEGWEGGTERERLGMDWDVLVRFIKLVLVVMGEGLA